MFNGFASFRFRRSSLPYKPIKSSIFQFWFVTAKHVKQYLRTLKYTKQFHNLKTLPLFKSTPKISIFCSLNAQKILLSRFVEQNIVIKTKTQKISFAERHYLLYIHRPTKSALHVWVFLIDYFNNF